MKKTIYKLRVILAFSLAVFMAVSLLGISFDSQAAKKKKSTGSYAEGDDVAFGRLDGTVMSWTILKYDETTKVAFVVARKPLTSYTIKSYRQAIEKNYINTGTKAGYVRWSENYWRGWCNEVFYKENFTDEEREKIQKTTLTSEAAKASLMNFYHDTSLDAYYTANGKKNSLYMDIYESQTTSSDYIFFLSSDEYTEFKDNMKFETGYSWPLRTNAYDDPNQGLFVDDSTGLINRNYYYSGDGIRPAMYVQLGDPEETTEDSSNSSSTSNKTSTTSSTASTTSTSKNDAQATTTASTTNTATNTAASSTNTTVKKKSYANNGTNIGNINLPDDSSYSMTVGATAQAAIDMEYLNSTDKEYTVTYKSSNANVFTVDSSGKLTAVGSGTANLTVRMKKSNGKIYTMSCRIDVA
ncbi:DUF6273 domain-containing protein [Pseudobutyrivibrio sp. MD2005]|uniref:DUF6273 domain-containing protein n=1 Tax=Pseudobutyrivibrio sp. MD2005 TaxID=1410616 RepID=UPI0004878929|nr:DUF6273 domain-containing protein [Pseudobutyrivibrio sp. MD2005]